MRTRHALLAAALIVSGATIAQAQQTATYDPSQLPAIQGRVGQYSLTPRGDVDGLILTDGTEVHMPPHLGTQLVFAVKPGDAVTVHGLSRPGHPDGAGPVESRMTRQAIRLPTMGPAVLRVREAPSRC